MKTAQHPNTHQPVVASADAPMQALCPRCGGVVTLRHRKSMNGRTTFFWRHQDNHKCSDNGRSRPTRH